VKRESNEGGLIPPAFFALAFENKLQYHYLYVLINSSDRQPMIMMMMKHRFV